MANAATRERWRTEIYALYTSDQIDAWGMEYITTNISLQNLAKKHDVPVAYIYTLSSDLKWADAKRKYQGVRLSSAARKAAEIEGERMAVLRRASDNLDDAILRLATSADTIANTRDAQCLARALVDAATAKRDIYGLPTPSEQSKINYNGQKIKIEGDKLRLAQRTAERANASTAEEITVKFADIPEDLRS